MIAPFQDELVIGRGQLSSKWVNLRKQVAGEAEEGESVDEQEV